MSAGTHERPITGERTERDRTGRRTALIRIGALPALVAVAFAVILLTGVREFVEGRLDQAYLAPTWVFKTLLETVRRS